jgi:hypothetical protein
MNLREPGLVKGFTSSLMQDIDQDPRQISAQIRIPKEPNSQFEQADKGYKRHLFLNSF